MFNYIDTSCKFWNWCLSRPSAHEKWTNFRLCGARTDRRRGAMIHHSFTTWYTWYQYATKWWYNTVLWALTTVPTYPRLHPSPGSSKQLCYYSYLKSSSTSPIRRDAKQSGRKKKGSKKNAFPHELVFEKWIDNMKIRDRIQSKCRKVEINRRELDEILLTVANIRKRSTSSWSINRNASYSSRSPKPIQKGY